MARRVNPGRARAAALLTAVALACATKPYDPAVDRCNPDASFERGVADGNAGLAPDLRWVDGCRPEVEGVVARAYRDGHAVGTAARSADAPPPANGGVRSERAYFCEVQARGETFAGYGANKIEADAAARAACREKNADLYCQETSCRRNE